MSFIEKLRAEAKKLQKSIIFPEGADEKIMGAAWALARDGLCSKVGVVGTRAALEASAAKAGADLSKLVAIDPAKEARFEEFAAEYAKLRAHKGITIEAARAQMLKTNYWGAMAVRMGDFDGMVSGIDSATKPFIPAFEIVKTRPGIGKASSFFFEVFPDKVLFYADCGMNIDPDEDGLADIAIATALSARQFWHAPRVAMLSFSTRDSAKHPMVDKVKNATAKAKAKAKELGMDVAIDGEIQFDAAFLPAVAAKKAPDSPFVQEGANVFVFPDLNSGNICYKVTERLAGAMALGPIFQGLNKPVNDLSRGAKVEDIVNVALVTVIQTTS
jgi:phosphate acetyltransferase